METNYLSLLPFYSQSTKPASTTKLPIEYSLELRKSKSILISIDQVTNELYIFSINEEGTFGKFRVYQGSKLMRVLEYPTRVKIFIVSNSMIYLCGNYNRCISKLSSSGDVLAKVSTSFVQDLCFSQDRMYCLLSEKILVYDEDLRILFKVAFLAPSGKSWIIAKFNVVFIIILTFNGINVSIYSREGDLISRLTIDYSDDLVVTDHVVGMDSLGNIILHNNLFQQEVIKTYSVDSSKMFNSLDLGYTERPFGVAIDSLDRIVTMSRCENTNYYTINKY